MSCIVAFVCSTKSCFESSGIRWWARDFSRSMWKQRFPGWHNGTFSAASTSRHCLYHYDYYHCRPDNDRISQLLGKSELWPRRPHCEPVGSGDNSGWLSLATTFANDNHTTWVCHVGKEIQIMIMLKIFELYLKLESVIDLLIGMYYIFRIICAFMETPRLFFGLHRLIAFCPLFVPDYNCPVRCFATCGYMYTVYR